MPAKSWSWRRVYWPQGFSTDQAAAVLRQWAADTRSHVVVLELHATRDAVTYRVGCHPPATRTVLAAVRHIVPQALITAEPEARPELRRAVRLRLSTRHRALRVEDLELISRAVLTGTRGLRRGETLVMQLILGPRRIPLAVPNRSPSSLTESWLRTAWQGVGPQLDSEKRKALRAKVSDHGFAAMARLGARSGDRQRSRQILLSALAGLRTAESAGLQVHSRRDNPDAITNIRLPWLLWPLRLNVPEAAVFTGWPLGKEPLPGVPPAHPRLLRADPAVSDRERVLAQSAVPGEDERSLGLNIKDAMQHLHVVGPTGTGKSTLLLQLILQDIAAGRGVVVIDPKGDLVNDLLRRIPAERDDDVVVLDPADTSRPVGMNPLAESWRHPDLTADGILAVFHDLYVENWGPRTQDILHASLLTLARRRDTSLVLLPLLLTNAGFRRSITATINDPVALGPFWAWFESISEAERQQAIAPVMNKLRPFLLRPAIRAMVGQTSPRFSIAQVFTEQKTLLVSLSKGRLGSEAAKLLGSLIVTEVWLNTLRRASIPTERRRPVTIYVDEVQDYLRLPTDLSDALAQARGYNVGFSLAHQLLTQLPATMRDAVFANARSRVCFQLSAPDAATIARTTGGDLEPADFQALPLYHCYVSLVADGRVTSYGLARTLPPPVAIRPGGELRAISRERWGQPLDKVELGFAEAASTSEGMLGRRPRRTS